MRFLYFVTLGSAAIGGLCDTLQTTPHGTSELEEPAESRPPQEGSQGNQQAADASSPKYSGSAVSIDCLTTFNEARTAAGLPSFVSAGNDFRIKDLTGDNDEFIGKVCQAMMTQTPLTQTDLDFNRTIALAIQDGDNGDCAAAVTHFNGALSLFGDLPPAFSTEAGSVYKQLQAVSFVALYNPKENPKLDCGYFTCKKSETTTTTPPANTVGKENRAGEDAGTLTVTATLHGLLCATSPPALIAGQAPFEQEQYDKIKGAINSASAAVPAFFTLAIVAAASSVFY